MTVHEFSEPEVVGFRPDDFDINCISVPSMECPFQAKLYTLFLGGVGLDSLRSSKAYADREKLVAELDTFRQEATDVGCSGAGDYGCSAVLRRFL